MRPPDNKPANAGSPDEGKSGVPPKIPDHDLLRCIGSGSYGEVWLARNVMGTYRAVKIVYRKTFSNEKPYDREYSGIKKFEPVSRTHGGLVDVLQVGRNDAAGYYYHVMELCDDAVSGQQIDPARYVARTLGNELSKQGRLAFDECLHLGLSLAAALSHLHKNGLIHRDIKPSNIIFVNGIPKIADIGLVTDVGAARSFVGTEGFIPLEGPGTVQADIYSLGKVLYEISTGRDRQTFPELPTRLDEFANQKEFLELNEVVLRACENDVHKRYPSADAMQADLLLLQTGKSVKRLRLLENRWVLAKRMVLIAAVSLAVVAGVLYQVNREIKIAGERRQRRVGQSVSRGTRAMDEGDLLGALPSLVEALSLDQGDPLKEESHRLRIGAVLRQCPRILQMWSIGGRLNKAQISSDGNSVITAGVDGMAGIWDIAGGGRLLMNIPLAKELECASFSPDRRRVALGGEGFVMIQSLDMEAKPASVLRLKHPEMVYSAKFSPDGTQIVTAFGNVSEGHVWVWDATTGHPTMKLPKSSGAFRSATFSPDGRRIATASEDRTAQVWDLPSGNRVGLPIQHKEWVYDATFSPDGRRVVTASFDKTAQVSDSATGVPILAPFKHPAPVRSAEFSPDGRYVVTACGDFTARVWDAATGEPVGPPLRHGVRNLVYASFTPDGRRILTADANGMIRLWDLVTSGQFPPTSRLVVSRDGEWLANLNGNRVTIANTGSNSISSSIVATGELSGAQLNRDGIRLITLSAESPPGGGSNTVARVWDRLTGEARSPSFSLNTWMTNNFSLDPAGERLVTFAGNTAQLWDAWRGTALFLLPHSAPVRGANFSPNGNCLVTWSGTNATVWESSTGAQLGVFADADTISYAAFSPDNLHLVVCSNVEETYIPGQAQIWNVASRSRIGAPLRHADGVLYASFSTDGRRVVTASEDATAQVWDANTGRNLMRLGHPDEVYSARFSSDDRWIVTACRDKTARVWDAETGEPLTPPMRHSRAFYNVQFIARGKGIVTWTSEGDAATWDLARDRHPIEYLARLAEVLSGSGRDYGGSIMPVEGQHPVDNWQWLRREHNADFLTSPGEIVAWHWREAEASEAANQWWAAVIHWDQLLLLQPGDARLTARRARAQAAVDPSAAGAGPEASSH